MNKKTILIIGIILLTIVIFSGCTENNSSHLNTYSLSTPILTPKSMSTEHQIMTKPVMKFTIKKGDDRTVTITCPDGTTISHNYTVGNEYICPINKTVVKAQIDIAIIKEGVVLVPLRSIITGLGPLGLNTVITTDIHTKPVTGSPRWSGTKISTYHLEKDNVSMTWSEGSNNINISGQIQKLSGEPFREDAMYITYYDDGPRYKSMFEQSYRYKSTITFVPLKDFVQPFGYKVEQIGDIVTIY